MLRKDITVSGDTHHACCVSPDIYGAAVSAPLLKAAGLIQSGADTERSTSFLRRKSKWHQHLKAQDDGDLRLWEVAVLFHLRDAFRSGDVWLSHSKRYGDLKQILVPAQAVTASARLMVPPIRKRGLQIGKRKWNWA